MKLRCPHFKFNDDMYKNDRLSIPYNMAISIISILKEVDPRRLRAEIGYYHGLLNDTYMSIDDKTNWGIYTAKKSDHITNDITLNCLMYIKLLSEPFRNICKEDVFSIPVDKPTMDALLKSDLTDISNLNSIEYIVKYLTSFTNYDKTEANGFVGSIAGEVNQFNNPTLVSNAKSIYEGTAPSTASIVVIADRFSSFLKESNITDVRPEMLKSVYTKSYIRKAANVLSILYNLFGNVASHPAVPKTGANTTVVKSTRYNEFVYQIPYRCPETAMLTTSPVIFRHPTAQLEYDKYREYVDGYFHNLYQVFNIN